MDVNMFTSSLYIYFIQSKYIIYIIQYISKYICIIQSKNGREYSHEYNSNRLTWPLIMHPRPPGRHIAIDS